MPAAGLTALSAALRTSVIPLRYPFRGSGHPVEVVERRPHLSSEFVPSIPGSYPLLRASSPAPTPPPGSASSSARWQTDLHRFSRSSRYFTSRPPSDRERIYERVRSPVMWEADDYHRCLLCQGFQVLQMQDWSAHVARSYSWIRDQVEKSRDVLLGKIDSQTIDRTMNGLGFWVDSVNAGKIG